MKQNTSHAVMARRFEPMHSANDFPTPPWATRALFEHVLGDDGPSRRMSCLEPACGAGHWRKSSKSTSGASTPATPTTTAMERFVTSCSIRTEPAATIG